MFRVFLLKPGDDRAAFVAQGAGLVQFGVVSRGDETTIAGQQRRFGDSARPAGSAGRQTRTGSAWRSASSTGRSVRRTSSAIAAPASARCGWRPDRAARRGPATGATKRGPDPGFCAAPRAGPRRSGCPRSARSTHRIQPPMITSRLRRGAGQALFQQVARRPGVTVRSTTDNSDPARPHRTGDRVSSRLRRVAASI